MAGLNLLQIHYKVPQTGIVVEGSSHRMTCWPQWHFVLLTMCSCWYCNLSSLTMSGVLCFLSSGWHGANRARSWLPPEAWLHTCRLYFKLLHCVLWCRAEGWRHWWILQTPVAPARLISVCLHRDFKLLHMDLCLMVLTSRLARFTEGKMSQLWGDKAFHYQAWEGHGFGLVWDKYFAFSQDEIELRTLISKFHSFHGTTV